MLHRSIITRFLTPTKNNYYRTKNPQHQAAYLQPRFFTTSTTTKKKIDFDLANNDLDFPEQKVLAGTEVIHTFAGNLLNLAGTRGRKLLVVSDKGVSRLGIVDQVVDSLKAAGFSPVVFDETQPNPTVEDVKKIASAYVKGDCDLCVGVGGGGPLDAMKGCAAIVAQQKADSRFSIDKDGTHFLTNQLKPLLSKDIPQNYSSAIPLMAAIPTTAGTGSEGGKSAVITDPNGVKFVFGNPLFFPKLVGLIPQFTSKMPPSLTAGTGIDALFHLLEAYFVTDPAAYADGLDNDGITRCNTFALEGTELVARWLPQAYSNGSNLDARLHMQIASLYGAKAFRKGDLGGIHACAHALGAYYHIHHGTAIARMAVPVLTWNEQWAEKGEGEEAKKLKKKLDVVLEIFKSVGGRGENNVRGVVEGFVRGLGLEIGLKGLNATEKDVDVLAEMASKDGCQTNPVRLDKGDYKRIFTSCL